MLTFFYALTLFAALVGTFENLKKFMKNTGTKRFVYFIFITIFIAMGISSLKILINIII